MAKKCLLVLALAGFFTYGVFAQSGGGGDWKGRLFNLKSGPTSQKGTLFVDLGYTISYLNNSGFGVAAGWEQRVNSSWTWLVEGNIGFYGRDYGSYKYSAFDLGGDFNVRYYLWGSALDKLFLDAGLGFVHYSWAYKAEKDVTHSWGALIIPLYAGWKFILGPGFVIEPAIGYRVGIGVFKPDSNDLVDGRAVPSFGGLAVGLKFGWVF